MFFIIFRSINLPERSTPVGTVVHSSSSVPRHSVTDGAKREGMKEGAANMSNVFYDKTYDDRVKKVGVHVHVHVCTRILYMYNIM